MKSCVLLLLFILISCTKKPEAGSYKVKIPVEDSNGNYSLQIVELPTLENPETVESAIIKVRLNSRSYQEGIDEQIPRAQYILTKENVIIPKDVITGQLFSLYKIMEDLYFFDKAVGTSNYLSYPRIVSLQTKTFEFLQSGENNANYDKKTDRINIHSTTQDKLLPFSFYRSIIAHEHFHAIYRVVAQTEKVILNEKNLYKTVNAKKDFNPKDMSAAQKWNFMFFDMVEEGLADYWAHLVTGKIKLYPDALVATQNRNIDGMVKSLEPLIEMEENLSFDKFFSNNLENQKAVAINLQAEATNFANLMSRLAQSENITTPQGKAKWLLVGLTNLKNNPSPMAEEKVMPSSALSYFLDPKEKSSEATCNLLNEFLSSHAGVEQCL